MTSEKIFKFISTVGFIGYIPIAPGTFGALAGLGVIVFFKPSLVWHLGLSIFSTIIGVISSGHAEKIFGQKDPPHIVIDEFTGCVMSLLCLPFRWDYVIAAFILFRFFDIIKPQPLRRLQHLKGGIGVMADDIGAAMCTNVVLQVWKLMR